MPRGTLFLVVGPSGVGKDTLIDAARAARPDILIPRRIVTRATDAGGEDIVAVTEAEFASMAENGGFALQWGAHGLRYAIPANIEAALAGGRDVIANASRSVVADARRRFQPLRILSIKARPETLARRLAARGRETPLEMAGRLERAGYALPVGPDVVTLSNDGPLAESAAAFIASLSPVRG